MAEAACIPEINALITPWEAQGSRVAAASPTKKIAWTGRAQATSPRHVRAPDRPDCGTLIEHARALAAARVVDKMQLGPVQARTADPGKPVPAARVGKQAEFVIVEAVVVAVAISRNQSR